MSCLSGVLATPAQAALPPHREGGEDWCCWISSPKAAPREFTQLPVAEGR